MGALKNYLNELICACCDEQFGQNAIEHAILNGQVSLSCNLEKDTRAIMEHYSEIIMAYREDRKRKTRVHQLREAA
jgi:hypothetical protein